MKIIKTKAKKLIDKIPLSPKEIISILNDEERGYHPSFCSIADISHITITKNDFPVNYKVTELKNTVNAKSFHEDIENNFYIDNALEWAYGALLNHMLREIGDFKDDVVEFIKKEYNVE